MIRRALAYVLTLSVTVLLFSGRAQAQSETMVIGTVTSSVDGTPMPGVNVFTFKTVGEARAEFKIAEQSYEMGYMPEFFKDIRTAFDGTYEVTLPVTGAIIFYKHPFKPKLEIVGNRSKINVEIEATRELDASEKIEEYTRKDDVIEEEMVIGNLYSKKFRYDFNKELLGAVESVGKTNARLVSQVYVVRADGSDTLQYMKPHVMDGEQYHKTQTLWRKDTLYSIADQLPRLTNEVDSILFDVKFEVPDKSIYYCKANIWIEDYIKTYYQDTCFLLSTARVRRPFQFLEYTFDECNLDHNEHMKPPRKEQVNTAKNMKLQFKVGKAELDMTDSVTVAALDSLKEELRDICADPAAKLRELHFEGYSSPEGTYAKNKDLSNRRTLTVRNEVFSIIPRDLRNRIYETSNGYVSGWDEVAALLERDSLLTQAAAVREIVEKYPDNLDRQGADMRRLPYYTTLIKERLGELRQVKCKHLAEVMRFLTPEEILEKYNTDEAYRNGKKVLTLNEYWHLFALIKDQKALEGIYKRALIASRKTEGRPWALPANNLAVLFLKREQADTNLLKPFLKDGRPMNYSEMDFDTGQRIMYNHPEVIANQAQMFMLAGDFQRAVQLTDKVKTKYALLDAVCKLLGRYKLDVADRENLYKLIEDSSPRNKVVMRLYQKQYDSTTVAALLALPQEDALTDYLKCQRLCRQYDGAKRMQFPTFSREEDPGLVMPGDTVIVEIDVKQIEKLTARANELNEYIVNDKLIGLDVTDMEKELVEVQDKIARMEKGEPISIVQECTVYEVAYHYLKRCFERDKSYIDTARGDLDIDEELLNDVLGIKPKKK